MSEAPQDEDDGRTDELTTKQVAALQRLLAGDGVEQAAKLSGSGERSVRRWLSENVAFKRELRSRQRQAMEAITGRLQSSSGKAVEALERVLDDRAASHAAVVSAAKAVLDAAYRGVELGDLAQRIEELEAAAERDANRGGRIT